MSLIVALCLMQAQAALPTGETVAVELERTRITTRHGQALGRSAPSWKAFVADHGASWRARFDEGAHTARVVWGPGITLSVGDVLPLVQHHAELFGVEGAQLSIRSTADLDGDRTVVDIAVRRHGVDVWRGDVQVHLHHGRAVMFLSGSAGDVPSTGSHTLDRDAIIGAALRAGPRGLVPHHDIEARRWWRPLDTTDGVLHQPLWEVRSRTASPHTRWSAMVDGTTGEVVHVRNEALHLDGALTIEHGQRIGSSTVISPLVGARVSTSADVALTDDGGAFSLAGTGPVELRFSSPMAILERVGQGVPTATLPSPFHHIDGTTFSLDVRSAWVHLHAVDQWAAIHAPGHPWTQTPVPVEVHVPGRCNAWFDDQGLHFQLAAGGICRSMATVPDMVAHEWAHGLHFYGRVAGSFDSSLSEGAADVMSFLMTGDPVIAPEFFLNPAGPIRLIDHDRRWPEDYSIAATNHDNGLLFSGSMYDAYQLTRAELGDAATHDAYSRLLVDLLALGPTLTTAADLALAADDDDGDLSNGTPLGCALAEGFAQHGLGPVTEGWFTVDHTPSSPAADVPITLTITPTPVVGGCVDPPGTLSWQIDDGPWTHQPVTLGSQGYTATLPAAPAGAVLSYYLTVDDPIVGDMSFPIDAPSNAYTTVVGPTIEVSCESFEAGDGGYTHLLVSGTDTVGADDWEWGRPRGRGGDPARRESTGNVWGNDLGMAGFNGTYQSDKHNRLDGPVVDLAHYDRPLLRYKRWLMVEDGAADQATLYINQVPVWANAVGDGTLHHLDTRWVQHHLPLHDPGPSVRLSFSLQSDDQVEYGGWTIDDVCVLAPDTPDNRLGITGIEIIPWLPGVLVTWNNPRHGPVERVALVHNDDHPPQSVFDGTIVREDTRVKLGERAGWFDRTTARGGRRHYAVFAFDGTQWLSWSREGLNQGSFVDVVRP